jgi:hypothetical protein
LLTHLPDARIPTSQHRIHRTRAACAAGQVLAANVESPQV